MEDISIVSVIVLIILIFSSAFFSATETAFSSLNKIRLKNKAREGNKKAKKTLEIAQKYDSTLSTILIGNNIVNIAAASVATIIFTKLYGPFGVGISTIFITILVLIFGEITPKSLAKENAESFAMFSTPTISLLNILFSPLNKMFEILKTGITKFFHTNISPSMTEEELKFMVDEIENEGILKEHESDLIKSAIEFDDITVEEILTPRVDVIAVEINNEKEYVKELFIKYGFSRLPVYEKNIDNIVGVIHEKDFFKEYLEKSNVQIKNIIKEVIYAPETLKISKLLKTLQKKKSHIAIIVDSYGGTFGLVTLEDILEQLVGDIWDEYDEVKNEFIDIGNDRYIVSGDFNIYDMFDNMDYYAKNFSNKSISVSGWVAEMLGKIPEEGDDFTYKGINITVKKANDKRVIEVIAEKIKN